jgi:hypothetical protein
MKKTPSLSTPPLLPRLTRLAARCALPLLRGGLSLAAFALWFATTCRTSGNPMTDYLRTLAAFLFTGLALASWAPLVRRRWQLPRCLQKFHDRHGVLFWFAAAFLAISLAAIARHEGMRHFFWGDFGHIADTAWRVFNGQNPVVDFPMSMPPGFYLAGVWAYKLLGVTWSAIAWINPVFVALTFPWSLALLLRLTGRAGFSLLAALSLQFLSTLMHGVWWFNPVSYVCILLLALSAACLLETPRPASASLPARLLPWLSYAAALLAAAFFGKPSTAGVAIIGVTSVMLAQRGFFKKTVAACALALAAWLALLLAHGLSPVDIVRGMLAVSGRGASATGLGSFLLERFWTPHYFLFGSGALAALLLLPASLAVFIPAQTGRRFGRLSWLALVVALAGLEGFLTNCDMKILDMMPLAFAGLLRALAAPRERLPLLLEWARRTRRLAPHQSDGRPLSLRQLVPWPRLSVFSLARWQTSLLLVMTCWCAGIGLLRVRAWYNTAVYGAFFEFGPTVTIDNNDYFRGLKTSPVHKGVLDDFNALLPQLKGRSVWNAMHSFNAACGFLTPKGVPGWFDQPDTTYPASDIARLVQNWDAQKFDVLIFYAGPTGLWGLDHNPPIWEKIKANYTAKKFNRLLVFLRNPPPPS